MKPRILLVNPPIYDFAAYDFWLKPYGMLSVAGKLRHRADFALFDYLDRLNPFMAKQKQLESDSFGRGRFYYEIIESPKCLEGIPRHYRRFGLPRGMFRNFLEKEKPFDFAFIQTMMTYWYPGVGEVIEDIRKFQPGARIIFGGVYVTLCAEHARKFNPDFCVEGANLDSLWQYLGIEPDLSQPALWEVYDKIKVGTVKLTDGCPFNCTYCSVPKVYGKFNPRFLDIALSEFELLSKLGVEHIAFYDDALLFSPEHVLIPFLNELVKKKSSISLHSPNALNARFVTSELAELMVKAGFKTFYLGFESASSEWQQRTGSKVFSKELADAVNKLITAGASSENTTAYQILGHPHIGIQELEESIHFVSSLGIRGMLADFSPIPDTPDGEYCRRWVDLDEPLMHNKTAFPVIMMGFDESNRLKDLQRQLNRSLK